MTLTAEAPTQARNLQVRTDPAGKPLAIRYDGQIWLVDPATAPQHWFELGGVEHRRVQARLRSDSALRTFTLRRDALSSQWLLEAFNDGD